MERAAPEGETGVFGDETKAVSPVPTVDLKTLHAKIGDLAQMRRTDGLHFEYSFTGRRMLQGLLKGERFDIGRLHVTTLMKEMGIEAIYRQPNASKPAVEHKIYPYLLRKLAVTSSNQVWAIGPTPYLLPVMHDGHGCTEK